MEKEPTLRVTDQPDSGIDIRDMRHDLAADIYELYRLGLIAEEVDAQDIPRFRPTGKRP
jgi:hypothetical protein